MVWLASTAFVLGVIWLCVLYSSFRRAVLIFFGLIALICASGYIWLEVVKERQAAVSERLEREKHAFNPDTYLCARNDTDACARLKAAGAVSDPEVLRKLGE